MFESVTEKIVYNTLVGHVVMIMLGFLTYVITNSYVAAVS